LEDRSLGGQGLFQQSSINEAAFFGLSGQISRWPQIGPLSEYDKKFSLLSVGSVFHYPRRDLVRHRTDSLRRACNRRRASAFAKATADKGDRCSLLLTDGSWRSDSSNGSHNCCNEEQ